MKTVNCCSLEFVVFYLTITKKIHKSYTSTIFLKILLGINPYQHLEKTSVLQETRVFNETPVNARRCITILSKIMCLLNQGDQLGSREATECFFAMTKLFQSKDVILRRMVYLGIKELSTIAEDVIIVTSSLTKDMTGKEDLYRASAIRALSTVTDGSMLQTLERYMKQCIGNK